ncbi:ribosome biogenesis factor YjgA [Isoalcanivorax beigongshangi]|uniref:Dual-action ribosomal maturation protein DarP n=1 Tax=Isoalcanivorax beigongshangi TaxID=3238810 RepID=A0ABV4ALU8_9GAMM
MDEYNDDLLPSKSALKREVSALQDVGEQLMSLKAGELARLPLTEPLLRAIDESRRITSHEARRRHAQFIGKLMRGADGEAIERALAALTDPTRHKRLLDWMERLDACADSRAAQPVLNEITDLYSEADRQHLRNLLRNYLAARAPDGVEPDAATRERFKRERRKFYNYLNELERHAPLY